jgi:RimJ/RimL family protein N-acetyltransferase
MDLQLLPATESDVARIESMFDDPALIGEFNWSGWIDVRVWRRRWEENRLLGERSLLIIVAAGESVGCVSWLGRGRPGQQHWEIGISLRPEARGKGYGPEAERLLVRYLFEHTLANRVQAVTEVDNVAAQRSLEKAGFTREGVLRGYSFRAGSWRDEVMYSVLRSDVGGPA